MSKPGPLVDTYWLEAHLGDESVKIFDSTICLDFPNGTNAPYVVSSGRSGWEKAHIPGAHFVDLLNEISDTAAPTDFTMLPAERFCEIMASYGVNEDSTVVVYSSGPVMWATRLWWMFRSVGFESCHVLDGGLTKWTAEGRPVTAEATHSPDAKGNLTAQPRPELWASKQEVMEAIGDPAVCTINALSPQAYSGERDNYGRGGHIPGSINIFYGTLIDPKTGTFLSENTLKELLTAADGLRHDRVICYCGGGISATMDALALHLCGHRNIAVYDGSMKEWAADNDAPLRKGLAP